MVDFIVANYMIFVIAAVVLLLGLFGYIMDRKKYEDYKQEIINQGKIAETLDSQPNIDEVSMPVAVDKVEGESADAANVDPMASINQ